MELHDASGAILRGFPVNTETNPNPAPTHQQTVPQVQVVTHSAPQQVSHSVITKPESTVVQTISHPQPPTSSAQGNPANGTQPTAVQSNPTEQTIVSSQQVASAAPSNPSGKKARMPGTKECPSCHGIIAAAVAKCPKCSHVFREKKVKIKRSGKRGKKNCPKCNYENPSACSTCKNCKYVFRLKLMDRYKQMRPRQANDSVAAAAAAAAHAAANMGHGSHGAVAAVGTVPLPAGVATFAAAPITPGQMHQAHVMPPLTQALTQHSGIALHHNQHTVHPSSMSQIQPMTQTGMHPHQAHPQL